MLFRSQARLFEALATRVRALHSYTVPEIIALPVLNGTADYLDWIQNETRSER